MVNEFVGSLSSLKNKSLWDLSMKYKVKVEQEEWKTKIVYQKIQLHHKILNQHLLILFNRYASNIVRISKI